MQDEFGRSLYASTLESVLTSYLQAGIYSTVAISIPLFLAGVAATQKSALIRWGAHGATRVLDTIPLFFWMAIIFSVVGAQGFWAKQVAIALAAFPFTLGITLDRFAVIVEQPFVQNARASGMGLPERLCRLIIPNGISSLYYPSVIIFGLSLTFDAVLGIMGMANRSTPSIGTLLWRAKERAAIDPALSLMAGAAITFTIVTFTVLKRLHTGSVRPLPGENTAGEAHPLPTFASTLGPGIPPEAVGWSDGPMDLSACRGHGIGISGPSGVGKTTMIEAIARANARRDDHTKVLYLPQNPRDLFPSQLTAGFVVDSFAREQPQPRTYENRCRTLMSELGLNPQSVLQTASSKLSGGEIQRTAIAILLAANPDLLLADEPTASLDAQCKAALAKLFLSERTSRGLTLLVASHDTHFLHTVCPQVLEFAGRTSLTAAHHERGLATTAQRARQDARPVLDVTVAEHQVRSSPLARKHTLLSHFHHTFHCGMVYGVSGPSGVGKSTLLRIVAGHEHPTRGNVKRCPDHGMRPFSLLTPQDPRQFFDPDRPMEAFARLLSARTGKELAFSHLADILAELDIRDPAILKRRAHEVSGGEAQRLALAVTLWLDPALMCLDEIDTGIPLALKSGVARIVRQRVVDHDRSAVIVSHDRGFLSSVCDYVIELPLGSD